MTENLTSGVERSERPRSSAWLWPLLPIAIATFALSALVAYQLHGDNRQAQSFLQRLVIGIYSFAGFVPSFFFFLLMLSWSSIWFLTGKIERPVQRVLRLAGLTLALAIWVNLQPDGAEPSAAAGQLGSWLGSSLVSLFGHFLSVVLVAPLTLGALLLATDFFFYRFFEGMHARLDQIGPQPSEGVETQVTEHLKGLSQVIAQPAAASATMASDNSNALSPKVDAVVGDEADEEPIVLRRLSSFERRQRALASDDVGPGEESSEPAAESAASSSEVHAQNESLPAGEDETDAATETAVANETASAPATANADAAHDLGDELATAESEAAEPAPARLGRRGRLAPIVAAAEGEAVELQTEPTEAELAPASAQDNAVVASATESDDRVATEARADSVDSTELEAPADESVRAEPPAELAPADEDVHASDALPGPSVTSLAGVAEAASDSGPSAAEDDGDYFAAVADEPPEVEPIIELEARPTVQQSPVEMPAVVPAAADVIPAADAETVEEALAEASALAQEPVIPIPRPPEGVRQQRLFVGVVDDSLVRDAIEIVTSSRRASATHLQRKLRVDYGQAIELLQVLAHRGLIDLVEGESQGRVR